MQSIRQCSIIFALFFLLAAIGGCGNTSVQNGLTGLNVSGTALDITLNWNAVSGSTYNIYRGTASGQETFLAGSNTNSFNDDPPAATTTTYYYYVAAVDSNNNVSGPSNEVSVTVTAPTLLLGTYTPNSVVLDWTTPSNIPGISSYNIYRSTVSGAEGLQPVGTLGSTPTTSYTGSYTDTTVLSGTTYYYRVTAVGTNGESIGSNEIQVTP